jgi:3-oxoacyl-[acyl-carrier protein] reductase
MSSEDWAKVLDINLTGTFNFVKASIKYLMKAGSGKIVNISSVVGRMGNVGQANYSASKAGMIGLTKSVAKEFASRNITCNAIAPGFIATEMTHKLPEAATQAFLNITPMKRPGTPEDVAKAVCFFCTSDSDYITGQVLNVDGGMLM